MPATTISDHSFFTNLEHQFNDNWKITTQLAYLKYRQQGTSLWPSTVSPDGKVLRTASSWDAKSDMTLAQAFVNGNVETGSIRHRILGGIDIGNKEYFADWGQYHDLDSVGAEFDSNNPYYGVPVNGYPHFDYSTPLEERAQAVGGTINQRYTGVYVQDELGFLDNKIRLTLAGRYTTVKQSEYGGEPKGAEHFTPRVGLSVSIDKETSVYALYDEAFIPQSGKVAVGSVKPLTGRNMELGLKKDWAGGKWNSTVSVYRILKNNELTPDPNSPPNAGLSIVLGEKRSEGVEIDVRGRIINGLNVAANYAYTDSRVTKVAEGVESLKEGDVVPGYAKHTANGWLTYKIRSGALRGLGFSGGVTWLLGRETYWDPSPNGGAVLPDYFKMDAGVSWEQDNIKITANVFNVLDKYLYSGSYYSYLNAYYWQADPPRNVRLSFNYSF
jgi:iron complex outermembrane receptor protein